MRSAICLHSIGLPYEYYCLFHWDHHRYTQDPDRDPELLVGRIPASDTQLAIAYTGLRQVAFRVGLMLRHAFTGEASAPWIPEGKRHIVVKEARLYVAFYAVLLLGSLVFQSMLLLWVWIVPLIVGQLFRDLISTPNTPAATGRAAPFRTPAPPIPA